MKNMNPDYNVRYWRLTNVELRPGLIVALLFWLGACGLATAQSSRPGMGSIPYANSSGTGVSFRVWAPNATNVGVRGDFNNWVASSLVAEGGGNWSIDIPGAIVGQQYRYHINGSLSKRDPRSRRVTNSGSSGNSVIYDSGAFDWSGIPEPKPARKDTVMYQMHIGTFAGSPTPRTFDHATNLLDHVQRLGINVIQAMPVNEFAGNQSWGYNPADQFAIESSYGGPDAFKRFVRACHQRGIAVFMDVVHNHYGPSDTATWRFDNWYQGSFGGIYFYNDNRAYTPWGNTRPDYGRSQVRDFIRDQILMFINEYRIGGFRWDAPYYIINSDQGHNQSGEFMLRDINWELSQNYSYVQRIAEDNAFDYSMNFQSQWDVASRWTLHGQITTPSDANRNMFTVRDMLQNWASLNRVLFSEAHDYIAANHGRSRLPSEIDTGNPESYAARKRSLLAAGIVLTAPAIPMIFQGQEMLETQAFHDNVPLRWSRTNSFAGIVDAYSDLIHVRRNLRGGSKGLKGTGINVHHIDNNNKVIGYVRWDAGGQSDDVVVIANFAYNAWTNNTYTVPFPSDGIWYSHFNSDASKYQSDFDNIGPTQLVVSGGSAKVNMGRYSMQIFSKEAPVADPVGALPPFVTTIPVTDITNTTATGGGHVLNDGGATVTVRGIVWNTVGMPTTNNSLGTAGGGIGSYTTGITGLTTGQFYFVRAYAINSAGISYGEEVSFVAGATTEPGMGVDPLSLTFYTVLGGSVSSQTFTVTNTGIKTLIYTNHQNYDIHLSGWMNVSASNFSLGAGAVRVHTVAVNSISFTTTGVFIATNRVDGNQTNDALEVLVTVVVTEVPAPGMVSASSDGAELIRLKVSGESGQQILVVHSPGASLSAEPTNGAAYAVNSMLGNGRVIYKFTGSASVSNLEHVVSPGTTNFYTFYSISGDYYSTAAVAVVIAPIYQNGTLLEQFGYTNGVGLQSRSGGLGWTNAWSISVPRTNYDAVVDAGNFTNNPVSWPTESGNRFVFRTTNSTTYAAFRGMPVVTGGQIYVAAIYHRKFTEGPTEQKFSGISFYEGSTERAFVGERGGTGFDDVFGVLISGQGGNVYDTNNTFRSATDYLIIGRYDFESGIMAGIHFTNNQPVPVTEPSFFVTATGTISQINGIRLASGGSAGWNGDVYYDEIRVATSWTGLMQSVSLSGWDSDGDGIPDWWMLHHFGASTGNSENISMDWQDHDDDGSPNIDEYIADTHPQDPDSVFHLDQVGADFVSLWSSTGRFYDLEISDVTSVWWSVIISNQPGNGNWLSLPITNQSHGQWYRARVKLKE